MLNEQMIEMMLATLVYPLLLQPLLLYCQRLISLVDEDRFSFSDHPFGGIGVDLSDIDKALLQVSGPAKAALITLASVFKLLTNRPLLRLLYTVLFHPLSPDSTSAPTLRSKLEVAMLDDRGSKIIRLDQVYPSRAPISDERTTYAFGTYSTVRRHSRSNIVADNSDEKSEACVFVLAPALAEVLEFQGTEDIAFLSRTRTNSYRRALLKCLTVPEDMSDVRDLAICTFDAALSLFDKKFNSKILFGEDLKMFSDEIPADERTLDSMMARSDDRGIGRSVEYDSRHALGSNSTGKVGSDLTHEIVSAICSCVVYARRLTSDEWQLGYDEIAAHALLSAIAHSPSGIVTASKIFEQRWRQAAITISKSPNTGLLPMGGITSTSFSGAPSVNDPHYDDRMFEYVLDLVFYDNVGNGSSPATENFVQLKANAEIGSRHGSCICVSRSSTLDTLTNRVGNVLLHGNIHSTLTSFDKEMVEERRKGVMVWLKLDVFKTFLKDLAASGGLSIRNSTLDGFAYSANGSIVKLDTHSDTNTLFACLSNETSEILFSLCNYEGEPEEKSVVELCGRSAIPCVYEVPHVVAHYFLDDVSRVELDGITWQSLYIIFIGNFLVFVQPIPNDTDGKGRVIASCTLERIMVERDQTIPDDGSPARRLSITHKWFDKTPPPLFLFDSIPTFEETGPFIKRKPFSSRIDLWFENDRSAERAFSLIAKEIFKAKADRGRRLRCFLDPQNMKIDN